MTRNEASGLVTRHEEYTNEAVVHLKNGEVIKVPLDRSATELDWYWHQVCDGVIKHFSS